MSGAGRQPTPGPDCPAQQGYIVPQEAVKIYPKTVRRETVATPDKTAPARAGTELKTLSVMPMGRGGGSSQKE